MHISIFQGNKGVDEVDRPDKRALVRITRESDSAPTERIEYRLMVRDIPSEERPRERLRHSGAHALANHELLAIILRTGTTHNNVLEIAMQLLSKYGGFNGLMRVDFTELCNEHGLGVAKTAQLKAALEIGRRLSMIQPDEKYQIRSPVDVAHLLMPEMAYLDHERMRILILNTRNQIVDNIDRYRGTVNSSVLRVSEIFRPAITRNCPSVIVCHNHPSGDPTPSREDIEVTQQLVEAGKLLDIELLDHIVIGESRFISIKDQLRW